MKSFKLLALGVVFMLACFVQGQVSVNVRIGSQPSWAPSGYNHVRYYYLPDVEAYYDVQTSMFIYISGNRWIRSNYLPSHYRNYDLYHGYKVVLTNYHGNTPYTYFKQHKMKYIKGYRGNNHSKIGVENNRSRVEDYDNGKVQKNEKMNDRTNHKGQHKNNEHNKGNKK